MPVATVPTYTEMWVHPQVVAALSGGQYTYTDVPAWDPAASYARGDHVLSDDPPYGYVYTASAPAGPGVAPPDAPWNLDQTLTTERLALFTATTSATWMLDSLTNWRLHGIECWSEDYQVHTCTIRLRRSPVTEVHAVTHIQRCNTPTNETVDWCRRSAQQVSICCGGCTWSQFACGCDNNVVRIDYTIGSNLPPGTEAVAAWLAIEYGKASSGAACALPERVQSVTRQGVSWTILDPQEYLSKGLTGMSRVDNWLAPVKRTIGGQLIDPLTSNVVFSRQIDCPTEVTPA